MPETTTTDWVCSRCGNGLTLKDRDQPDDWCKVYFANPPRAGFDLFKPLGDLCDPCGGLLVDFVNGKDIAEEMAKALEMSRIERWAEENVELATQLRDTKASLRALRATLREALGLAPEPTSPI